MKIVKLQGTDRKLYELVAPLVMSPPIVRYNNNYPFKTGVRYTWYVAVENDAAVGFMPLRRNSSGECILDNYYVRGDDADLLERLLATVIADGENRAGLQATVHKRHVERFARQGFSPCLQWKNYEKMRYDPHHTHVQAERI
ncbi:MAG: hypothetical protein IJC16_02970 [Rikenellaceae bacterium]|nr:hypothetical protein [Rikenellaceae bacterium]